MDNNKDLEAIMHSITCPISQDIMRIPVVGSDGNTYNKDDIIRWLDMKKTSPLTNEYMDKDSLRINPTINYLIEKYNNNEFKKVKKDIKLNDSNMFLNVETNKKDNDYLLTFSDVSEENILEKIGTDLVVCIDRSGSTQAEIELKNSNGNNIESGFSILDIIVHAAKTIASVLEDKDRFSVILFDDRIQTLFPLTVMNDLNKHNILSNISTIRSGGQTNIYGAIKQALNIIEEREDKTRNSAIIMLTDGQPNISPSRGEITTLTIDKKKFNFSVPIYTMGFGYNLTKNLLYSMAKIGNGTTCHIPDGGMVATVFCNCISTIKCTLALNIQIIIDKKYKINVYGDFNIDELNDKYIINLGTLQHQQPRNIIINCEEPFIYSVSYKFGGKIIKMDDLSSETFKENNYKVLNEKNRLLSCDKLREIINYRTIKNANEVNARWNEIQNLIKDNNELIDTFNDQVYKALFGEDNWFNKWGEFYLDQLSSHILHEKRPNFKDKACFCYGGKKFEDILERSNDIFDTLEPPSSSRLSDSCRKPIYSNLSSINNSNNPCFTGDCNIKMANNTFKLVSDLLPGDKIKTCKILDKDINLEDYHDFNKYSTVKYILRTKVDKCKLVKFKNGLKITLWHPIYFNNKWQFPNAIYYTNFSALESVKEEKTITLYSLVLDTNHIAIINNIPVICLGHNYENNILQHFYLGTKKVVNDLKKKSINGFVDITPDNIIRNTNYMIKEII